VALVLELTPGIAAVGEAVAEVVHRQGAKREERRGARAQRNTADHRPVTVPDEP
jgi:hypothetical protein